MGSPLLDVGFPESDNPKATGYYSRPEAKSNDSKGQTHRLRAPTLTRYWLIVILDASWTALTAD